MKIFLHIVLLSFVTSCSCAKYYLTDLGSEMTRLNVNTALIIKSEAIDEYPLWSSASHFVAANIMGKWYKFDLENTKLSEVEWGQQKIGLFINKNAMSDLTNQELTEFSSQSKNAGREVVTKDGKKIELKLQGFSSSLILTKNKLESKIMWSNDMENCHSLSLSPNEKYAAYICETSGLFLIKLY